MKHNLSNVSGSIADCSACGAGVPIIKKGKGKKGEQRYACKKVNDSNHKGRHGVRWDTLASAREGESCAICGGTFMLALDHDHSTGALRGWLCKSCNNAIGLFRDDVDLLGRAIKYLANPPGVDIEDPSETS